MAELPSTAAAGSAPSSRHRRLWQVVWVIVGATALFAAYELYTPTKLLGLTDGRRFDLLQYDRNTLALYDRKTGAWQREQRLLIKYYSEYGERDSMLAEARSLAPVFFRVADSLGLRIILLEPSKPLFTKSFPILITSWHVTFTHDSSGESAADYGEQDGA